MAKLSSITHHNHLCLIRSPLLHFSSSLKRYDQLRFSPPCPGMITRITTFATTLKVTPSDTQSKTSELGNDVSSLSWDNLGFDHVPTDYMFVMKCCGGDKFSDGELKTFGEIELNPFSSVLNYGQGIIENMKAYKKDDGSILLFRPEANALRMTMGADRMCMPAPTFDQFLEAVKVTVSANRRWIPPPNKGFLHIRPLLIGSGPVLILTPSPEFTFLIYVTPVRNYFESGVEPINLVVEKEAHRAVPGGVGSIKAIGNYAMIVKAQAAAKANGFHGVLYLDAVHNKYLEEVSAANIFVVKDKTICTPALRGTILPGITRESVIDIARNLRFQESIVPVFFRETLRCHTDKSTVDKVVEEGRVSVEELFNADEVFCTGTAVGLLPVGSITYQGKRLSYKNGGLGTVSQKLSSELTNMQMGLTDDKMGWNMVLK